MTGPGERIPVAILGPTGMVGQQFVRLLADHPWFRVADLLGSERSAGRVYRDVVDWSVGGAVPAAVADRLVRRAGAETECPVVFSALPSGAARSIEPAYRDRGHVVFTNAAPHRFGEGRVPVIPEVNGDRLDDMLSAEGGAIVPNPNCVVAGIAPVLAAIERAAGLSEVVVTTLQALSGAGLDGVAALAGLGNVIPDIPGEAEKIVAETRAIVGHEFPMSVVVNRVPVRDGHLASVRVKTRSRPGRRAICDEISTFGQGPVSELPSAPDALFALHDTPARPQPVLDVDRGAGMSISIGGLGEDAIHDVVLTMLVHNTVRGAAGGSILNAELARARGFLGRPLARTATAASGSGREPPS